MTLPLQIFAGSTIACEMPQHASPGEVQVRYLFFLFMYLYVFIRSNAPTARPLIAVRPAANHATKPTQTSY